jgi:hypothetical protein
MFNARISTPPQRGETVAVAFSRDDVIMIDVE